MADDDEIPWYAPGHAASRKGYALIGAGLAPRVQDAYREYRRRQHALRLNGAAFARVPPAEVAEWRDAVNELWQQVFGAAVDAAPGATSSAQENK